jgi:hypothetical protein
MAASAGLRPSDRAVFWRVLSKANYGAAELPAKFTPSQATIARETGLTERQVRRAERHLERHGWLKITGTTGPGKRRTVMLALGSDCTCAGRVHDPRRVRRTADTRAPRTADTNGGHVAGQRPVLRGTLSNAPGNADGNNVDRGAGP